MGWRSGLLIDRGYTGHEHLYTVGLIHMNGRVYDPLLRRFMSPDNYVQDVNNTQNYNRYGYVLNNPLLYTDPSGEFIVAALIGVAVGIVANGIVNSFNDVPFFYGAGKAGVMGGIGGAISFGIGSVSTYFGNAAFAAQAGMHGISGGIMSEIEG
ncbi:RHS repeat domain-containing protein, partial [Myroides indicus]|uniref:RHS repeat domain-containing protein n=1 Tax=Myroides indicus TaxID=1323422 RepID=UPI0029393BB4